MNVTTARRMQNPNAVTCMAYQFVHSLFPLMKRFMKGKEKMKNTNSKKTTHTAGDRKPNQSHNQNSEIHFFDSSEIRYDLSHERREYPNFSFRPYLPSASDALCSSFWTVIYVLFRIGTLDALSHLSDKTKRDRGTEQR